MDPLYLGEGSYCLIEDSLFIGTTVDEIFDIF